MKSFHTLDIPFVFYNIDIAGSMTGAGNSRYALAHKMSAAWAAFARQEIRIIPDLPNWPAFTLKDRATMILNNECKVVNDPNREERLALKAIRRNVLMGPSTMPRTILLFGGSSAGGPAGAGRVVANEGRIKDLVRAFFLRAGTRCAEVISSVKSSGALDQSSYPPMPVSYPSPHVSYRPAQTSRRS